MSGERPKTLHNMFDSDEVREVLTDTFYRSTPSTPARRKSPAKPKTKPEHYEVICISMYKEDLARLDETVAALKQAGHRKMSRSALIRFALEQVDVAKLPRSY